MVTPGTANEKLIGVGAQHTLASGTKLISGNAGRLCKVIVTIVTAVGVINFYDSASGNNNAGDLILSIPVGAAVGTVYDVQVPVNSGITVYFATSTGTLCVTFD